jgi:hypothetical protein
MGSGFLRGLCRDVISRTSLEMVSQRNDGAEFVGVGKLNNRESGVHRLENKRWFYSSCS